MEVKRLGPNDASVLSNVAEHVFDDAIVEGSARAFLADPRHRLVVAMDKELVLSLIHI